jgi:hypothetical protein
MTTARSSVWSGDGIGAQSRTPDCRIGVCVATSVAPIEETRLYEGTGIGLASAKDPVRAGSGCAFSRSLELPADRS